MTKISSPTHSGRKVLEIILYIILAVSLFSWLTLASAKPNVPYPLDSRWTYLEKPGEPVEIGYDDIPLGTDWTYECNLFKDYKYHIYCIGEWTNLTDPDTDYDIYVYDEDGDLISTHTQSAGLPEQVSNDGKNRYFLPAVTGYYSFRIVNDPLESQNSKKATFMIIQHIEPNTVYGKKTYGRDAYNNPVRETSWAYEFNVSAEVLEVFVDVPPTLDMYEVRLYPMANLDVDVGENISGALVPWEPGLRGELRDGFGGFNMVDEGYRAPDAFASCERLGQDMTLRHNNWGNTLYYLVLIAEHGKGTVDFYVKTDFDPPDLRLIDPPGKAYFNEYTPITVSVVDECPIKSLYIRFTDDIGETWRFMNMTHVSGDIYSATLPHFSDGRQVEYTVVAVDEVYNRAEVGGGFLVLKDRPQATATTCSLSSPNIKQNEAIEVTGEVTPKVEGIRVKIRFVHSTDAHTEMVETDPNGAFTCSFNPPQAGTWSVLAEMEGGASLESSQSPLLEFEVAPLTTIERIIGTILGALVLLTKPPFKYILYGATSLGAAVAVYKVSMRIKNRKQYQQKEPSTK